jgi:hypothetical protein
MPPIMASISRKSSNKVPKKNFRCYLLGDEPIIKELFFMGSKGFLWVWLWEVKILWVQIMGVTLVEIWANLPDLNVINFYKNIQVKIICVCGLRKESNKRVRKSYPGSRSNIAQVIFHPFCLPSVFRVEQTPPQITRRLTPDRTVQ